MDVGGTRRLEKKAQMTPASETLEVKQPRAQLENGWERMGRVGEGQPGGGLLSRLALTIAFGSRSQKR